MAEVRKNDGSPLPELFIACGSEDFLIEDNRKMNAHLDKLGYDVTYEESPGTHNWEFWDDKIQHVLAYIDSRRKKEV
jgi:S-formylglutathione hydrolase FrmB